MKILKAIPLYLGIIAVCAFILYGLFSLFVGGSTELRLPDNAVVYGSVANLFSGTNAIVPATGDTVLSIERAQSDLTQDQLNSLEQGKVVWKVQFSTVLTGQLVRYQYYWFVANGSYSPYINPASAQASEAAPTVAKKPQTIWKGIESFLDKHLFPGWGFLLFLPLWFVFSALVANYYGRIRTRQVTVTCSNLVLKGIKITGVTAKIRVGWVIIPADDASLRNPGLTDEKVFDVIKEPVQGATFSAFSRHSIAEMGQVLSTPEEQEPFLRAVEPAANSIGIRITEVSVISVELPEELKSALMAALVAENDVDAIKILMSIGFSVQEAGAFINRNKLAEGVGRRGSEGGNGFPVSMLVKPNGAVVGDQDEPGSEEQ